MQQPFKRDSYRIYSSSLNNIKKKSIITTTRLPSGNYHQGSKKYYNHNIKNHNHNQNETQNKNNQEQQTYYYSNDYNNDYDYQINHKNNRYQQYDYHSTNTNLNKRTAQKQYHNRAYTPYTSRTNIKRNTNTNTNNILNSPQNQLLQTYNKNIILSLSSSIYDKKSIGTLFLTGQRNSKFKLIQLQQKLQQLSCDIHNLRLDANHTLKSMRIIKQRLIQNDLQRNQIDLKKKIDDLKCLIKITKKSHEDRSNNLRDGYIQLWNSNQEIKQCIFQLTLKADKIANSLGYFQHQRL